MSAMPTIPPIPWFTHSGGAHSDATMTDGTITVGALIDGAVIDGAVTGAPMTNFPMTGAALIASPDSALRRQVMHRLNGRCGPVQQALGGAEALAKLEKGDWQVVFLDRRLPDLDAEELMAIIQRRFPAIQLVMLDSAGAGSRSAEEKTRDGSSGGRCVDPDFDTPIDAQSGHHDGSASPHHGPRMRLRLSQEPRGTEPVVAVKPLPGMIGTSAAMQRVYRMVRLVASRSTTVLIAGPTGSGKELVARALHTLSPRSAKPMVVVNCAAIPEALLESEMFGHARGAFTGAVQSQLGRIPAAHGGTLFLDEVSELPLAMQAKLLRFLEQKEIQRLGTSEVTRVDVRVLAASNVDLASRAACGAFRLDLFYRLSAFLIELPSLAEHRADIVPLAEHFLACMSAATEMPAPRLREDAIQMLASHPWRGNVRELQHVMERASILVEQGDTIAAEHLYFSCPHNPEPQPLGS